MAKHDFKLPDIGEGVVEGEIVDWHVSVGDTVSEDDPIVDVMTDKATVTIPSPVSGVVTSLSGEIGDMIAVGSILVQFDGETSDSIDESLEVVEEEVVLFIVVSIIVSSTELSTTIEHAVKKSMKIKDFFIIFKIKNC